MNGSHLVTRCPHCGVTVRAPRPTALDVSLARHIAEKHPTPPAVASRAVSMTYDPYSGRVCEAVTASGQPCRRRTRSRYEWRTESHYFCATHGSSVEPDYVRGSTPTAPPAVASPPSARGVTAVPDALGASGTAPA